MFRKISFLFPQKGSVLVFSLVVLAFMLISALSVATVSMTEKRASLSTEKSSRSFQTADSGIEIILQKIYKGSFATLDDLATSLGTTCNAQGEIGATLSSGTYIVSFYDNSGVKFTSADCNATDWRDRVVRIKSEGTSGNTTRAVEVGVALPVPPALPGEMAFTADGTFTVPAGVTSVTVNMVGGGGGGGNGYGSGVGDSYSAPGAAGSVGWGAGGGGGGTAANYNAYTGESGGTAALVTQSISVSGGQTIAVTVGNGGDGGPSCNSSGVRVDGQSGGTSSFGSTNASGGAGGIGGGGLLRAPAPSAPAGYAYGSPPTSGSATSGCAAGGKGAPGIVVVSW